MFKRSLKKHAINGMLALGCAAILSGLSTSLVSAAHHSGEPVFKYVCGCAMAVGCQTAFDQPGKCPCGKPLFKKMVVKEDDDYYYITRSAEPNCDCSHTSIEEGNCDLKDLYALAKKSEEKVFECIKSFGCSRGGEDTSH